MPFLTELDSRAAIKGSRDPLGVQPIWTRLGRHVVGNLTTVSTSVRDFTITMLGYYFAERVAEESGASDDLNVFLRWEQLAAYARGGGNNDWQFRGTERARKNWASNDRIRLGADSGSLILSDQKTYGLWGLYTVPSRTSGLLENSPTRLTSEARRFVEDNYLPILNRNVNGRGTALVDLLARPSSDIRPKGKDGALIDAVAKVLRRRFSSAERVFYTEHLVEGGPSDSTQGGQRLLADAMESTFDVEGWQLSPAVVRHLSKHCRADASDTGRQAAEYLERIVIAEQLLGPSVRLFAYLLSSENQRLDDVALSVRKQWGPGLRSLHLEALEAIGPEMSGASDGQNSSSRWLAIASALAEGDYATVTAHLIDQNREVMEIRGGAAPWLQVRDGRLQIKFVADAGELPTREELPALWLHSYFLDSLRTVTKELKH